MATFQFRLNVNAAQFPFLSFQGGASVISGQQDTYYRTPNAFSGETADKNLGIPQLIFGENFLPVSYGIQSIGFDNITAAFPGNAEEADQLFYLLSPDSGRRYLANFNRQNGKLFIYSPEQDAWILKLTVPTGQRIHASVAIVKGRCFFYIRGVNQLFEFLGYDSGTDDFTIGILSPIAIGDMSIFQCIVGANNYLIFAGQDTISYCIPDAAVSTNPDFTPDLATGAATETPSVLRGLILICHPVSDGFIMFTSTAIVAAYYSGNIRFPWSYRELEKSAPITSLDAIGLDREGYPLYANTTGGILKIGKSQCTPAFPEATEFFGGGTYEYYDWNSHSILTRVAVAPISIGVAYVGGRWLVLSYGAEGEVFTHALIFDEHLKRWGKVALHHRRAVEFFGLPDSIGIDTGVTYQDLLDAEITYQLLLDLNKTYFDLGGAGFAGDPDMGLQYKSMGFVAPTGVVQLVDFELADSGNDISVVMIGRVQLTRNHRFKITDVFTENLNAGNATVPSNLSIISTKDMRNEKKLVAGHVRSAQNSMVHHQFAGAEGWNHTLRYEGDFDLSTIVVRGRQSGTR